MSTTADRRKGRKINNKMGKKQSASQQKIATRKSQIYVLKIGGSAFDIMEEEGANRKYLTEVFSGIAAAHSEGFKMVLTCGAGPWGDVSKTAAEYFGGTSVGPDIGDVARSCYVAADEISKILSKSETPALCRTHNADFLGSIGSSPDILNTIIPVLVASPKTAQADYMANISNSASDAHAVIIADWLANRYTVDKKPGVELIFIKDTPGVFPRDPNRTDVRGKNERIKDIHIEKFLDPTVIDRTGTDGRGEHLLETIAGKIFRDVATKLDKIRIVSARQPGFLKHVLYGDKRGSIIYNKNYQAPNGNGNKPAKNKK